MLLGLFEVELYRIYRFIFTSPPICSPPICSHPNLHRHHIQGDVLQYIAKAIHQSSSLIHFHKVESHAGIRGNNYADAFAKKSMTTYSNVADTSIKQLALREIISTVFTGLQKDMKNTKSYRNHPNTAQSPTSRLWYQSNLP